MQILRMRERAYLTSHGHEAFAVAHELADQLGHDAVNSVHLALGIVRSSGVGAAVLHSLNVPIDDLERDLRGGLPTSGLRKSTLQPPAFSEPLELVDTQGSVYRSTEPATVEYAWTPSDELFLTQATDVAREMGTRFYGSEHLLLALLQDESSSTAEVFARYGVRYDSVKSETLRLYAN